MPRDEQRPIHFTIHARERLARRGVSLDEVDLAIRGGSWRPNVGEGWIARIQAHGTTVDVVFVESSGRDGKAVIAVLVVVTVIDVGRYRR